MIQANKQHVLLGHAMMTAGKMTSNVFLFDRCPSVLRTHSASLHDQLDRFRVLTYCINLVEVSMSTS